MIQAMLSRKGFEILVNCCVNTHTEKPSCLPENANLINSLLLFLISFVTAQSSKIIRVFVSENTILQSFNISCISSSLFGKNTKNLLSPHANPLYVLLWIYVGQIKMIYSKTCLNDPRSLEIKYSVFPQFVGPVIIQ